MEYLRFAGLAHTSITDEGLRAFCDQRPNIEVLNIKHTNIGDDGVALAAKCPKLQEVWLDATRVTEAGVREIAKSESIETITADKSQIGDELARELQDKGVTVLRFNGEVYESNFLPVAGAK